MRLSSMTILYHVTEETSTSAKLATHRGPRSNPPWIQGWPYNNPTIYQRAAEDAPVWMCPPEASARNLQCDSVGRWLGVNCVSLMNESLGSLCGWAPYCVIAGADSLLKDKFRTFLGVPFPPFSPSLCPFTMLWCTQKACGVCLLHQPGCLLLILLLCRILQTHPQTLYLH